LTGIGIISQQFTINTRTSINTRDLFLILLATVLAGCASTPTSNQNTGAGIAPAATAAADSAPKIVDTTEFLQFLDSLALRLENGDPRRLNRTEEQRVETLMGQLRARLESVNSVDELSPEVQNAVYNDTQSLWATVIGRDEDQVICRREHQVGTNRPRTRCRTIAQIREDQETARRALDHIYRRGLVDPSSVQ